MASEECAKKPMEKGWEWGDSRAQCVEQWAQGSWAAPGPLMVSLMAQNNCRTWLAMVTNTSQLYPAVAGSQRTITVTDKQVTDLRSQTAGAQTNCANMQIIKVHVEHHKKGSNDDARSAHLLYCVSDLRSWPLSNKLLSLPLQAPHPFSPTCRLFWRPEWVSKPTQSDRFVVVSVLNMHYHTTGKVHHRPHLPRQRPSLHLMYRCTDPSQTNEA
jgi:hypothetical protein